ncbi:O-antigen ligase family protein [Chroococcidiopsis sp.]|uniref:O-antigen ligase family protein n=1 Tax=Chroococcidiopsis sp. TaxID=3088168 RepID=UPI003F31C53B
MSVKPQNFEEKLVWYTIILTYPIYFLGAQLVWIPALGFILAGCVFKRWWFQTKDTPESEKISIPLSVWIWIVGMLFIELTIFMSHMEFDLGIPKFIFTTVNNWARSWALMALFPLAGCLKIRPQVIYRAACILCLQSLILATICYFMYLLRIPSFSYVSPLVAFRGSASFYTVNLFDVGGDFGEARQFRLRLFANFANNLGIIGNIYFFLSSQEANKKWRWIGTIGGAAMVVGSGSRSTIVCLVAVPIASWLLTNFGWYIQLIVGLLSVVIGMIAPQLIELMQTAWDRAISGIRRSSEVVRKRLAEVTMNRWMEAPIWGHGVVEEKGPKYTEHMPIGTHNHWPDLFYLHGVVGFLAFTFAIVWGFVELTLKARKSAIAKTALNIYLVLLIATAAVDIQLASYLYWQGLILTGIAFKEDVPIFADRQTRTLSFKS